MAQSVIQFGDNWVKVNESVFYSTPHAVKVLKAWYEYKKKYDVDAPEEAITAELEYLAKAFALLRPNSRDEAVNFLAILEDAYAVTDYKIKEIIDRVYANKTNTVVREL